MEKWANADKIFIKDAEKTSSTNHLLITKDLLKSYNCPIEEFSVNIVKPCDSAGVPEDRLEPLFIEKLTFHSDGSMERSYDFNIYPQQTIKTKNNDNMTLTPWGQAIFNRAIEEREAFEQNNNAQSW